MKIGRDIHFIQCKYRQTKGCGTLWSMKIG